MEKSVSVRGKMADYPLLEGAIKQASEEYKQAVGTEVTVTIDKENPLPETSYGGVIVSAIEGRIRTNNTLETRLELIGELMLPEIRTLLFGPSPNRKFFN